MSSGSRTESGGRSAPAIEVRSLVKRYGEVEAVRGVDFEVGTGEVFGFLGPNGAGKSTTITMLCTLAKPTSGSATVAGHDVVREHDAVRRNIGRWSDRVPALLEAGVIVALGLAMLSVAIWQFSATE